MTRTFFWRLPCGAVEGGEQSHTMPITRERRSMSGNGRRVAASLATLALLGLAIIFVALQWLAMVMQTVRPGSISKTAPASSSADALASLPLARGVTWVYAYVPYEPTAADPTRIVTATFRLTETVMETETASPYFVVHVQRFQSLVEAQPGWPAGTSSQPNEYWYLVRERQVYQSFQKRNWTNLPTAMLTLAYHLPLTMGESWCPDSMVKGKPVRDCTAAGQRTVVSHGSYVTPAGSFDDCYQITEAFNSGGVTRWFCTGIGVVAEAYDHGGTRFGFTQVLLDYARGAP